MPKPKTDPHLAERANATKGPALYRASVIASVKSLSESVKAATGDGLAWFLYFPMGQPEMDEEDYRQWELTPENAALMVAGALADLQKGEVYRLSYTHGYDGPKAGEVRGFELRSDGIWAGAKWTPSAVASINSDPSEWDGFSPEFYAQCPMDQDGNPMTTNGRMILRPFKIADCAGALTNCPSMVGLKAAASVETDPPRDGEKGKEDEMSATNEDALKGVQTTLAALQASHEGLEKAHKEAIAKIAKLEASRDLEGLVLKGRAELRISPANEPAVRKHFEDFGLAAAEAFVAALPPTQPRGGSLVTGNFGGGSATATGTGAVESRSPHDHVGAFPEAYDAGQMAKHQAAIAYMEHATKAGRKVSYRDALIATTRKSA